MRSQPKPRVFRADAVAARLADGIRTFDEVLASLTAQVSQTWQTQTAAAAANTGTSAMTTQKDQMLSSASPTAVAAAQKSAFTSAEETSLSAPAEAPAAPEPVASAPVVAAAPAEPKPGETCPTCDQVIPNDDDDGTPVDPNTSAPGYTVEIAMDTMDLCAIAKLYLRSPNRLLNSRLFYGDLGNLCRIADACRADLDHRLCDNFGNGVIAIY